jgi:hypothetical protein
LPDQSVYPSNTQPAPKNVTGACAPCTPIFQNQGVAPDCIAASYTPQTVTPSKPISCANAFGRNTLAFYGGDPYKHRSKAHYEKCGGDPYEHQAEAHNEEGENTQKD